MPFHGNFGMHDATWRSEFGGDIYLTNGSHGCLNLPLDKAAELYNYLYTGYPVICYY
jgi:lipoprotein-anchoring transpeptidase ErfK/SrfK